MPTTIRIDKQRSIRQPVVGCSRFSSNCNEPTSLIPSVVKRSIRNLSKRLLRTARARHTNLSDLANRDSAKNLAGLKKNESGF